MTTLSKQAEEAGRIILRCWTGGEVIDALPDECRPRTIADGYAAQRTLVAASSEPVLGWKIAATSASGQHHINVDGPIAGRLLASRVHGSLCEVVFGANRMAVAEVEFATECCRLPADLPTLHPPAPFTVLGSRLPCGTLPGHASRTAEDQDGR